MIAAICSFRRRAGTGLASLALATSATLPADGALAQTLQLNDREYFTTPGVDVLVFSNWYDGLFSDAKIAGVELIHHGERTATNGDVRLSPTPEQWDMLPELKRRTVLREQDAIEVRLAYTKFDFEYTLRAQPRADGLTLSVVLDAPLPATLVGKAGFNLEFLPSAYFGKTYLMGERSGTLPLYPVGPTGRDSAGEVVRMPLARGRTLTLAPEVTEYRVSIESRTGELQLLDGRNQAQNGWFVVRELLPGGAKGTVLEWNLRASAVPEWVRPTVVRPRAAYVGVYESLEWGRIEIVDADRTLLVTCGVLRALAEPFGKPDALWLELEPREGGVLQFEGHGTVPDSLHFDGRRFHRVTTPGSETTGTTAL